MVRTFWSRAGSVALFAAALAAPVQAQEKEITNAVVDAFLKAFSAETAQLEKVAPQLEEIDEKIRKWKECKLAFDAAGEVSGSKLGGLAAKAGMKARCGATSDEGFRKEKAQALAAPEKAALSAGGFKAAEYGLLKERLISYVRGDRNFKPAELDVLAARKADLGVLGQFAAAEIDNGSGAGGGRTMKASGMLAGGAWTADYAWAYIGQMFALMYMSGATMVEKAYEPGQWTKWELKMAGESNEKTTLERAFLARTAEGNEWWRMRYDISREGQTETVILEALFKPVSDQVKQLVRVRGKLPGNAEASELMVPQHLTMLSSVFPMKPTPESLDGATVGNEKVAGVDAKHVRFGAGNGGAIEWWLSDAIPGGWARFQASGQRKEDGWSMEVTSHGKGARSELGVLK